MWQQPTIAHQVLHMLDKHSQASQGGRRVTRTQDTPLGMQHGEQSLGCVVLQHARRFDCTDLLDQGIDPLLCGEYRLAARVGLRPTHAQMAEPSPMQVVGASASAVVPK